MSSIIILPHAVRGNYPVRIVLSEARGVTTLGVWVMHSGGMIAQLVDSATLTLYPYWQTNFYPTYYQARLSPALGTKLALACTSAIVSFGQGFVDNSTDDGATWGATPGPFDAESSVTFIDADGDNVFAFADLGGDYNVLYSTNGGASYSIVHFAYFPFSGMAAWLGAAKGGAFCYTISIDIATDPTQVHAFKLLTDGTHVDRIYTMTGVLQGLVRPGFQNDGAINPIGNAQVYLIGNVAGAPHLFTLDWGANTLTDQTLPAGTDMVSGVLVTSAGTILVFIDAAQSHVLRSVDSGVTWVDVSIAATFAGDAGFRFTVMAQAANGLVVVPMSFTSGVIGKFMYSSDDGLSWNLTADIGVHDDPVSIRAR